MTAIKKRRDHYLRLAESGSMILGLSGEAAQRNIAANLATVLAMTDLANDQSLVYDRTAQRI